MRPFIFDHGEFAKSLRMCREGQHKSVRELAAETGIDYGIISKIENLKYTGPQCIILLSSYINVNPTRFVIRNHPEFGLPLWKGK